VDSKTQIAFKSSTATARKSLQSGGGGGQPLKRACSQAAAAVSPSKDSTVLCFLVNIIKNLLA